MATITGSDRKANSPSAISIVGRSPGIVSGQCFSASDTGTEWECGLAGNTSSRRANDARQVHAVPVDRRRRIDAVEAAVEPCPEVDDDGVGCLCDEIADPVVEHLGAQRGLADHAGLHTEPSEVVVDLADHLVGQRVAEDRSSPAAVQRPGVLGEKCGLFDWCQFGGCNPHDRERTPVFGLNG